MKNTITFSSVLWAILFSLTFITACSDDDDDVPASSSDPDGTVIVNMVSKLYDDYTKVYPDSCSGSFRVDEDLNFDGSSYKFNIVGEVNGLNSIKEIPTSGWESNVAVVSGYGYVAKNISISNNDTTTTYVRIYVLDSNALGWFTVKYQSPFEP